VAEGHAFGSHTWTHLSWQADLPDGQFRFRATGVPAQAAPTPAGRQEPGRQVQASTAAYCQEIAEPARRFEAMTGQRLMALYRAPGGKTSPALLRAAASCGWTHVPWSPAGFLGDELPSERYPNAALLRQALARIQPGDILLAHLGIWSRREAWAPAVLEPLIRGLRAKGLCFATLREHPLYAEAARQEAPLPRVRP
jgi:peptidoglycan/xylan/chitin deacetylase (PgdA/CDA1 family)